MEDKDKLIDQSELANDVARKIPYEFTDYFLVKLLDPIKVKKEFSKPVDTKLTKDEDGIEAQDFEKVETEVKEVDSDYRKGIVLKCPLYYENNNGDANNFQHIKIGDTVIFRETAGLRFDLLKDSRLIRQYDILGIEK